jgi:hypothetical protein
MSGIFAHKGATYVPSSVENTITIRLRGEQAVRIVAKTHRALTQSTAMMIDAREMADVHLTVMPLIESARRQCAWDGKKFCMTSPPPEALREIVIRGGFLKVPDNVLFWTAP